MNVHTQTNDEAIFRLLNPKSIAVIGASSDFRKVSGRPLKHLLEKGYAGRILPVNPKYDEIAGIPCHASIKDLPEIADCAIIALPARHVNDCVRDLGAFGIKAAVVFSSGFGEMGDAGHEMEAQLAETARTSGVRLLGPNCLGFINAFENVYATFSQYADGETNSGPIAFVTQSGAFGTAIAALVRQRNLGLGYFINTGNQADLDFAELMMAVIEDPRIKVAAGYLEGISDGEALVRLAKRCRELGKPLVLTKVGRMESGARAAASHTGAMAVADTVFDAVIRQYGVLRARNEEQMLDFLEAFCQPRRATGNGLGIATQSGGAGVMMADRAEEVGMLVPSLGPATRSRLGEVMPTFGAAGNPVDVTGEFVARPELLTESVVAMLDDPKIDIAIVWLQLMNAHVDSLLEIFAEIKERTTKPFFVCWVAAPPRALAELRASGIAVFTAGERAVEAAAALSTFGLFEARSTGAGLEAVNREPETPPADGLLPSVLASGWLRDAGIPMAPVVLANSAGEAIEAKRQFNGPVALKIESPDIAHKTEIGGVILNAESDTEVSDGFHTLIDRAKAGAPDARVSGVLVQEMSGGHVELVVGVQRDPVFGMIVMVGLGGIMVEVLKDVTFRKAPFGVEEAEEMLSELRMSVVLDGIRGRPPVSRKAIARMLANLSQWSAANKAWLAELDLNPVLASADSISVVDCVMISKPSW
ncbi:acetate--CoA ligase family protein [Rhodobacteraceae bacterium NNCM2]|nr:acetate--CoA ligase family protein [Coraliihabitans acroporae]